jgi:iron complex outermembrane recepter protein
LDFTNEVSFFFLYPFSRILMQSFKMKIGIAALLCFVFLQSFAQCEVKGVIADALTGQPIMNPHLHVKSEGTHLVGGSQGQFRIVLSSVPAEIEFLVGDSIAEVADVIAIEQNDCSVSKVYFVNSSQKILETLVVSAFQAKVSREQSPAAIGQIKSEVLKTIDATSLQNAFNLTPGVQYDARGYGGSQRLSIRGSAMRAPTAIRNVKMYMEGIPLTSPDGQTPLEMIDASDVAGVEIIKGPAGSMYGSGNGGVLLYTAKKAQPSAIRFSGSFQSGQYGILRTTNSVEVGGKKSSIRFSEVFQQNSGYRNQEFNHKNQYSLFANSNLNAKHKLFVYMTYFNGDWALPGGLNSAQAAADPRQAVLYSVKNNTRVMRERSFGGLSHTWQMTRSFKLTSSVYAYDTRKVNPYGTSAFASGYKTDGAQGLGTRIEAIKSIYRSENFSMRFKAGGEVQYENYHLTENKLLNAAPGAFFYQYNIGYLLPMGFVAADLHLGKRLFVDAGLSLNTLSQWTNTNASMGTVNSGVMGDFNFLPRVAASYKLTRDLFLNASYSEGISNPTAFEMVDASTGATSKRLLPENGKNYEGGLKYYNARRGWRSEATTYLLDVRNLIQSYQDTSGLTLYENLGQANLNGYEFMVAKEFGKATDSWNALVQSSLTLTNYKYISLGEMSTSDIKGKTIPGSPKTTWNNFSQISYKQRMTLGLMHFYYDKMPLDNANQRWSNPYHLLNARLDVVVRKGKYVEWDVYAGMNNLLNAKYSSFYQLNANNGAYYNPATPSNWFAGMRLQVNLK